jgi:hypothetical protein
MLSASSAAAVDNNSPPGQGWAAMEAFVRRNIPEKNVEEALSTMRNRALPLETTREERSREQQRRWLEQRRQAAAAARRLPRAKRKALLSQSASKVTYKQLSSLRLFWKTRNETVVESWGQAARTITNSGSDGAPTSLTNLAHAAQVCRRAVTAADLIGADVRILSSGGSTLRRRVAGTVLDISANALQLITEEDHLKIYPLRGTQLALMCDPLITLWADALG